MSRFGEVPRFACDGVDIQIFIAAAEFTSPCARRDKSESHIFWYFAGKFDGRKGRLFPTACLPLAWHYRMESSMSGEGSSFSIISRSSATENGRSARTDAMSAASAPRSTRSE